LQAQRQALLPQQRCSSRRRSEARDSLQKRFRPTASQRPIVPAREMKVEGLLREETTLKSSRYLKNRIGRNHRNVKSRVDVMLGFKRFRDYSTVTISGIELMHRIR
jgi:transposase-like protein